MHITILGAGWLGCHLADLLLAQGLSLTLTCVRDQSLIDLKGAYPAAQIVQTQSRDDVQRAIRGSDAVIVCVAPSIPLGGNREQAYRDCYLEVARSLQQACLHTPSPGIWITISSTSVYGDQEGRCDEDSPGLPSPTGQILRQMEQIIQQLPGRHVVLRCGQLCGPGRPLRPRAPGSKSDAGAPANLTPLPLIEEAVLLSLQHPVAGIFNLVHPEHPSRAELDRRARRLQGMEELTLQEGSQAPRSAKLVVGQRWDHQRELLGAAPPLSLSLMPIWPPDGRPDGKAGLD
jgi:nucleoside-diphosphate-sugar epimerase